MYGVIAGVDVPYALPEKDGCKLGISCPIVAGNTYSETEVFPVLEEYPKVKLIKFDFSVLLNLISPKISLYVKVELQSDDGKDIGCFILPAKIVDPSDL